MEATKIQKNRKKRKKEKNKKREAGTLLFLLRDPHSYFILYPLYSIEIIIHAYNYVGILYTIELGLYVPMMSLLKRVLGLLEQASWMHPTSSLGELSIAHMCIRCMAIPTPHIISIIYGFLSPMIVLIDVSLSHLFVFLLHLLYILPFRCQLSCSRSSIASVLKISKGSGSI